MTHQDWQRNASQQETVCRALSRKTNTVSWLRLVAFCVAAGLIIVGVLIDHVLTVGLCYGGAGLFLLGFIGLVCYHDYLNRQLRRQQAIYAIDARYAARADGTWRQEPFADHGPRTPKEIDLDLYGPGSLFQYLNVAETYGGKAYLRSLLSEDAPSPETIETRRTQVKALWAQAELRFQLLVALQSLHQQAGASDQQDTEAFMAEAAPESPQSGVGVWVCRILAWALPIVTFISFFFSPAFGVGLCVSQFLLSLIGDAVFGRRLKAVLRFQQYMAGYEALFALISEEDALPPFRKLSRISECVKIRYNPLGYTILSACCLWNFHCVDAWDRWKRRYGKQVPDWLAQVWRTEAHLSLLTLAETRTDTVFPEILSEEQPHVHFTGLTHPLIDEDRAVGNDFAVQAGLLVITGSNMSGKTTFMRTLGTNLVLLYAGGPVCGTSMAATVMQIRTSMRISDHLGDGLSTFYAEVLRIRDIVQYVDTAIPVLVLIDEIYKGTNSKDRETCAVATAKRLCKPHCLVMMTTHDQALCRLSAVMAGVENYHFTERYDDQRLLFDYQLMPGEAEGSNATHLLKMAGIL